MHPGLQYSLYVLLCSDENNDEEADDPEGYKGGRHPASTGRPAHVLNLLISRGYGDIIIYKI